MSDKFNDILKSKLQNHEVPAEHLWQSVAAQIPASNAGFWKPWMTGVSATTGTLAIATMTWLGFKADDNWTQKSEDLKTEVIQNSESTIEQESQTVPLFNATEPPTSTQIQVVQSSPADFDNDLTLDEYTPMVNHDPIVSQSAIESVHQEVPQQPNVVAGAPAKERAAVVSAYFSVVVSDPEILKYFFFAAQSSADDYQWTLTNGETTEVFDNQSFSYQFEREGIYDLTLRVQAEGTELTRTQQLRVFLPSKLNPVNAFAPGNDGLNDLFDALAGSRNIVDVVEFGITDSNGRVVFQQQHGATWDGRINGELASPGRYLWTLEYINAEGSPVVQRGDLQLFAE